MKLLPWIGAICLLVLPVAAAQSVAADGTGFAGTSAYEFDIGESAITQTGGIAGLHRIYHLKGQFVLTVDPNAGTALFNRVDASGTTNSVFRHELDLNDAFDLTGLAGTVAADGSLRFEGTAGDGSSVLITAVFEGVTIHLRGETVPPPQSADFFVYELDAAAMRQYGGGTGEPKSPYLIYTAEQLNALGADPNDWDKHFQLVADIDLAAFDGKADRPDFCIIGTGYNTAFVGIFDGLGHTVRNFTCQRDEGQGIGLFGFLGPRAEVRNLVIQDANVAGKAYTGALIGYSNGGIVRDCRSTGQVQADQYTGGLIGIAISGALTERCQSQAHAIGGLGPIGGLVGANSHSTISQCFAAGLVEGVSETGGVTGRQDSHSVIQDCYSLCTFSGSSAAGGIVGRNDGSLVSRCCSAGRFVDRTAGPKPRDAGDPAATATGDRAGGVVGLSMNSGEVEASFWDTQTSGLTTSAGGTGKTTVEMQRLDTYLAVGWDFVGETTNGTEDIWWIRDGLDYPRLAWERVLSDGFEDGTPEPLWMAYEPAPDDIRVQETNSKLETIAVGGSDNMNALYVSNGWRLDVAKEFAVRVDFHFSARKAGDGWVFLGLVPSVAEPVTQWIDLEASCLDSQPLHLYEMRNGAQVQEESTERLRDDGTLYLSYDPDGDELYLSYTGYGKTKAWRTIPGLLRGLWAGEAVYVILGGGSEGMPLDAGDGWLDNLIVDTGTIVR